MGDINGSLAEQIAAQIDQTINRRFGAVERHINAVGKELETLAGQTAFLLRQEGVSVKEVGGGIGEDEGAPVTQVDETWQCVKCGGRLGYYDPNEDVLRIRHKDLVFWVHLGVGGNFSIVCRSCGELNSVSWSPPADDVNG